MRRLTVTRCLLAAIFCLGITVWGNAQSAVDGAISGTVTDTTGAAVPGAKIVIHNNGTNAEKTAVADGAGFFNTVHLQPGSYTVTIVAPGFNTYQSKDVVVQVGLATTIQPKLVIGSTATTVEVTAAMPDLNFTSPDFTSNISSKTIESLPINGRRWSDLTLLTPGVVSDSNGFGLLSFRGISPLLNNVEIDGADDNQGFYSEERGRTREGYSTSQAAVREFQVNSGVYSAEYGRAAGGVINSITKSGTNNLHGTAYFYDRDNNWGATNPFTTITLPDSTGKFVTSPYKPKDWRKQWGGVLGGPIVKDKLFFLYVFDQYRRNFPGIGKASNPGTFFTTPDASLPEGQTCNTTTGVVSGGTATTINRAACVLAARLKFPSYEQGASLYTSDLDELAGDLGAVPRTGDQVINTPKLDWQINGKQHVSFLFHRLRWDSPGGVQTSSSANYAIDSFGTDFVKLDYGLARLDSLITNSLSNEVRYQYGRELDYEGRQTPSAYTQKHFTGTTGVPVQVSVATSTGFTAGAPYYSFRFAYPDERKWQVADTANWTHGSHNVKFGIDMVHNYDLQNNLYEGNGKYGYTYLQNMFADQAEPNGTCTSNASSTGVGTTPSNSFPCYSSLVLGFGTPVFDVATMDYGFFVQDDWKATPRLTLNLGLRYDYEALPKIGSQFINPAFPETANHPSDRNNFGPRIGFAYDPFGLGKTVLRGGFGMYFGRVFNAFILDAYANSGVGGQGTVTIRNTARASGSSTTPLVTFPNIVNPGSGSLSSNIEYLAKNLQNPMVNEFDLTVQQDVGHRTTLSVTYLGALGRELPNFINTNLNKTYSSSVTVTPATNGGSDCGPLACGTVLTNLVYDAAPSSLNNPNFQATTKVSSIVNSNYNALVGEVQNHTFKLVQFDANYTWSHALDFNQNQDVNPGTNGWLLIPGGSNRVEYGNSNFNVPNRLVAYAMVYIPSHATGWAKYLLNGWQVNPLLQMQNGLPYTLQLSGFQPNVTIDGVKYSSFGSGLYGSGVPYIPQLGRNTYRVKRAIVTDVRAQKDFTFEGKYTLELLGELFNAANHQNVTRVNDTGYTFSGDTLHYNSSAGSVTNSNSNYAYSPRQVQLAVRLQF